ncbi:hypothetical protein KI811_14690 [Geobacter hydrogenophilus]|nr:hypothetical protein [Geobacter hydrogenophilus]MBT0895058.1 hypothetical protein [Geobacter hydrogenophilus]
MAASLCLADSTEVELLTSAEGAIPNERSYGFASSQILENSGPAVELVSPSLEQEQKSPFSLRVKFTPRPGTSVDLGTLKVEALKLMPLNVTSRVRPYASATGIHVAQAKVPSGVHKIRFTLGDSAGGITKQVFVVTVR